MSAGPQGASHGLTAALRTLGGTLVEILETRGGLFAVELREELGRRKRMLALGAVAFAFLHTALLLATLLVVAFFWDEHRIAAIAAMAALYAGCGAVALQRLVSEARAGPEPFAATLDELQQDFASLRTGPVSASSVEAA
jgi:uncharacterized membrane protein YqjE